MDLTKVHLSHLTNAHRETFSICDKNWQKILLDGEAMSDQAMDVTCDGCLDKLQAAYI